MKTTILIFSILFSALLSNAQFKIADRTFDNGFGLDTSKSINIKVIDLKVEFDTKKQRPAFYIEYVDKNGSSFQVQRARNVYYQDLVNALTKKVNANRPQGQPKIVLEESYLETTIAQIVSAVIFGTKQQKLAVVRDLMQYYNTTVLPDNEQ